MSGLGLYRSVFFIAFVSIFAYLLVRLGLNPTISATLALASGVILLGVEYFLSTRKAKDVLAFITGLSMALIVTNSIALLLSLVPILKPIKFWLFLLLNIVGVYIFGSFIYHKKEELRFFNLFLLKKREYLRKDVILLDTSAIIDGRIIGIAKAGFLYGRLTVPQFVLNELHKLSDSKDHSKRTKGRRGLDILKELQQLEGIDITITREDIPRVRDVDGKLIEFAKKRKARIMTVDFNLNKLAGIHGVSVLNINELANELKPVFLPGDILKIKVIKTGKEENQGIGYLSDGTMVVVEEGKGLLNKTVQCEVVSVLQTDAGRMIFTRPKET